MESQEVNDGVAKIMGLKSPKVLAVSVQRHEITRKVKVIIEAYASKVQIAKIKALLMEYLKED